ncbi:UvrD-helicase domain-containing protein [Aetokthonos hydrillicola Thurmond2011]|jgi:mRNA-degrading endonuclease RelE of RelBE toxin-antitoxin system|uniref:DNA 3'-5' helicase n=1 Tax=Aetokthonos hydrillicola Thurmond2011 TaxID=2712845 RepID=A0AAP5IB18_9CYAN|nr:3'-5' exonuclease [Aetokthonos hydrillicola]MBW4590407.1 UvrD-helicase domain-containing protein [Aetokthonos hydrillicola CCALA 1050]MDR9898208.1 UvrD-helicase domain-containing protein [Aetokthonos hydrillicola Thurmond2011]
MTTLATSNWTVSFAHTFLNEVLNVPKKISQRLSKTIKILEENPISAQGDAKKLKNYKNVYRVRIGEYRLIYSLGQKSIKLLSLRKRNERTYELEFSESETKVADIPECEPILEETEISTNKDQTRETKVQTPNSSLPTTLTSTLLSKWRIPEEYWQDLQKVQTEDDLLNLPIPHQFIERILDNLFPRSLEEIVTQPEYFLQNPTDLERYVEGQLTAFLLKLDPEQEKLRDSVTEGPTLVKGGPGTGKSTLALYQVQKLYNLGCTSILFTTYTNALVSYSQQLLTQLLEKSPEDCGVKVVTVDSLTHYYYKEKYGKPNFAKPEQLISHLETALQTTEIPSKNVFDRQVRLQTLQRLGTDYLLEEILNVIESWGVSSLEEYVNINRQGRVTPLQSQTREAIWAVYQNWLRSIERDGLITWEQLRRKALEQVLSLQDKPYQAILIDEAQDLSPVALRFLLALVPSFKKVYLTADASQSLYQRGFSWKQIHTDLKVSGRTLMLKRNYRNTKQIAIACAEILEGTSAGDKESLQQLSSPYQGNFPTLLLVENIHKQVQAIGEFFTTSAKQFRLPIHGGAVLCPNKQYGEDIARHLTARGWEAQFVSSKKIDLNARKIKVLTLHSAKGLEFPFVAVVGLNEGILPRIDLNVPPDEVSATLDEQRRLFYVGCTRAMRALIVCGSQQSPSQFFTSLSSSHWQKQQA